MPVEEKEQIDIFKEFSELKKLEKERQEIGKKIEEYIAKLSEVLLR
jgi:type I restriction-modification system DNA methylase subunit